MPTEKFMVKMRKEDSSKVHTTRTCQVYLTCSLLYSYAWVMSASFDDTLQLPDSVQLSVCSPVVAYCDICREQRQSATSTRRQVTAASRPLH